MDPVVFVWPPTDRRNGDGRNLILGPRQDDAAINAVVVFDRELGAVNEDRAGVGNRGRDAADQLVELRIQKLIAPGHLQDGEGIAEVDVRGVDGAPVSRALPRLTLPFTWY